MSRHHDSASARGLGVISSIAPQGKGFIFATDVENTEYFVHCSTCRPAALFDELAVGDKVSFSIAAAPKGMRAHDVRRMTESEEEAYRQQQREHQATLTERRGNSAAHGERQSFVETTVDEDVARLPGPRRRRK